MIKYIKQAKGNCNVDVYSWDKIDALGEAWRTPRKFEYKGGGIGHVVFNDLDIHKQIE